MVSKLTKNTIHPLRLTLLIGLILTTFGAKALPLETYAQQSILSEGNWVKVAVSQSGIYKITKSQLQSWGFTDISKVHIYGYGGKRIEDRLSTANYKDDLPMLQTETLADGIVFYAVGPEAWTASAQGIYHSDNNIYTTKGYYFVSDREVPQELMAKEMGSTGIAASTDPTTSFTQYLQYETDSYSPGEAGYILVGESFKSQNNREFAFSLPGRVTDSEASLECTIVAKTYTQGKVNFTINGEKLAEDPSDKISIITNNAHVHAGYNVASHKFTTQGEQLKITVSIENLTSILNAWLNYIAINYERKLELTSDGYLNFISAAKALKLNTAGKTDVRLWDVTDHLNINTVAATASDNALTWTPINKNNRTYTAWAPSANLPQPEYIGTVANQDLHAIGYPDMVIFTLPEYKAQAERLARLHASALDSINAVVVTTDQVYNEFASGSADVSALRKCLKMIYDRAIAADTTVVQYALLMGRATIDNRHLTSQFQGTGKYGTIPVWMGGTARSQFSDNDAFGTDDFIAMLEDDSGTNLGLDNLCVAVGRMPVTSLNEARYAIDKLEKYINESRHGNWRNSFIFLADDGDNGIHLQQTEEMIECLDATPDHQNFISKVYVDAYDIIGGICEGGRRDMFRMLDEGVVWWNFCGHANNHSWTGEKMLTYTDINNMLLKNVPVLMAATCDFLRWDSNTVSGGEILFHEANGGTIATISATRPVYISDNGLFTKAVGRAISQRKGDGKLPRLGDIYRNAKNNILNDNGEHRTNSNRLRYVLMGDPAMALATPDNIIKLEAIGDQTLGSDEQVIIKALQQTVISGAICTPDGKVIDDFNGVLMANIYDAEKSSATKGEREENVVIPFEQHGGKLFSGSAIVTDGHFQLRVAMPSEIADNFRPAAINMYAYSNDGKVNAVGVNRDFYVYGLDENVDPDNEAPVIESLVLNETSFTDGDKVNTSPLLISQISDNVGINISSAGIGHQMTLTLDGKRTFNDVSLYFTPANDGSPTGTIAYPLSDLTAGEHTLTLRIWDTASNSASKTVTFNVVEGLVPDIYRVYTDVNPARTEVKFYIEHNRPEAELTATITVYDLLGRKLWDTEAKVPSDMNTSYPISWDLCDSSGHRVPRGIYLYRATISDNKGETYSTASQRLAITAQ